MFIYAKFYERKWKAAGDCSFYGYLSEPNSTPALVYYSTDFLAIEM